MAFLNYVFELTNSEIDNFNVFDLKYEVDWSVPKENNA